MDMKEFLNVKSKQLNAIDNGLGLLAGIGAYHFLKRTSTPPYRSGEYGAVALTGLSVLQVAGGIEAAEFVRKRSRFVRLSLINGFSYQEDLTVDGLEDYQTITVPSEEIANNVMGLIESAFEENKVVTVSDLYDFCGLSSSYRDVTKGWVDISNFRITKIEDGKFLIDVPKADKL